MLSGIGLWVGPIPRPEESYRLWCVSVCYQVKINNLDTCCEQIGKTGKDYETKRNETKRVFTYLRLKKGDVRRGKEGSNGVSLMSANEILR
jgi:hypothetical protein